MALVSSLKDELTCSVCYDIYNDPYVIIKCLHTFCLQCIQHLQSDGQIRCPECRVVAQVKDTRKDFKTQRLIDIHKVMHHHVEDSHSSAKNICGLCEEKNRPITAHCTECCKFICAVCQKIHMNTEALRCHNLQSVSGMIHNYKNEVEETILQLKKEVVNIDARLAQVSTNATDIKRSNLRQIAHIHKFTDDIVKEAKENEKRLTNTINETNGKILEELRNGEAILKDSRDDVLFKISLLNYLIKSYDTAKLPQGLPEVHHKIRIEAKKIRRSIQSVEMYHCSPVNVREKADWAVTDITDVILADAMKCSQQIPPLLPHTYPDQLRTSLYQLTKRVELKYPPLKLIFINRHLWCLSSKGNLYVYDIDCEMVKEIEHSRADVGNATGFAILDNGHIIIACCENKGLHDCFPSGNYNTCIAAGSFCDVTAYKGNLCTLDNKHGKLVVFTQNSKNNKWIEKKQVQLQHNRVHVHDRVCINTKGLYISSWENNCIYAYDDQFKFRHKIGGKEHFDGPILSGLDEEGKILVCDYRNRRLQVWDNSEQCHAITIHTDRFNQGMKSHCTTACKGCIIPLPDCRMRDKHKMQLCDCNGGWHLSITPVELGNPTGAVIADDGDIWIIQNNPEALVKITM